MASTCQWSWIQFLWIILPLTFAILVWVRTFQQKEPFLSTDDTQTIIQTYKHILNRSPTSTELAKHIKEIDRKEYGIHELEIRLYNSDEYKRLIKTQDNGLSPELSRMVEEKEVIKYIQDLYTKERRVKPKTDTLLPLKDLYIYMDYNSYKFTAMLRNNKYPDFEEEFLSTKKLSKDTLLDIYKRYFDDLQVTKDADTIRKTETIAPLGKQFKSTKQSGAAGGIFGLSDTDKSELVNFLVDKGFSRFQSQPTPTMNADGSYSGQTDVTVKPVTFTTNSSKNTRYYLTPEDTIQSKSTGFSLGKHPPVCVPVGVKHPVSPVVFGDLLGATLDEAKDTSVGSIMPKFEYKEYIEIPTLISEEKSKPTKQTVVQKSNPTMWQTVPPTPLPKQSSTVKEYSPAIQKYDAVLKPALEAFAKWKNEMNTTAFYTEMASSKDAKAFFKKYPYMVDILALYVYEKSAERASINQVGLIEYYSDIGYYTKPEYRYGTENTHFSTYMTLSYFNQFYTSNRAVIDECIKLNTCLTESPVSTPAPKQYSPEVQKYKDLSIIAVNTISKNKDELEKPSFVSDLNLYTSAKQFLQKYPFMLDILKFTVYIVKNIDSLPENEIDAVNIELSKIAQEQSVNNLVDKIIEYSTYFYIRHQIILDDCLPNNSCLTDSSSAPKQYSPEVQKYKSILEAANKALQDNVATITTPAFSEEMALSKEPKVFFKKYPYMIDLMKLYIYEKSTERTSLNATEVNNLYMDIGYYNYSFTTKDSPDTKYHISIYLESMKQLYLNNRVVIDECIKQNTCLTDSTTIEPFTNRKWYGLF